MSKRRILKARITHISLVPKGANRMPVIYKEDGEDLFNFDLITKEISEQGEVLALVYSPGLRDSQGDIADADVIKQAAYEALRDGISIDIRHDNKNLSKDAAYIAESFIVQKNDPRFEGMTTYDGEAIDPTGSWGVVLKIEDPDLRKQYREGDWNGVSMGGTAVVQSEKSSPDAQTEGLRTPSGRHDSSSNGDLNMDRAELETVLKESNEDLAKTLTTGISDAIAKALTPKKEDEPVEQRTTAKAKRDPKAPVFKGDPTNPEDVQKHQRALALYGLRKDVDWDSPDSIDEYMEKMADFEAEFGEITEDDRAVIEGKPVRKAAASTVPASKPHEDESEMFSANMNKEDLEAANIGVKIAQALQRAARPVSAGLRTVLSSVFTSSLSRRSRHG
jgi:hypothetical protein